MQLWHSSATELVLADIKIGFHLGTQEQAIMRRPGGILHLVKIEDRCLVTKMRDRGHWTQRRLAAAARRADIARYLNRYEGVAVEHLDAAARHDDASDTDFLKAVPSCCFSWIVLRPAIVTSITPIITVDGSKTGQ